MEYSNGVCCAECTSQDNKPFPMFRPRGALSRALYNKHISDLQVKSLDKDEWYRCELDVLRPEIRDTFIRFHYDRETQDFLESCENKSDCIFLQMWYTFLKSILSWFLSQTNINGLLRRGSMFVFSSQQASILLNRTIGSEDSHSLIDLGAGDGKVTQILANYYSKIYVTEVATTMRWLLKSKGFTLLDISEWDKRRYHAISCLNLLDRCENPLTLLNQIKQSLEPGGHVIIAIVLPYRPYVETGSPDHNPTQYLPIFGNTFEEQVNSMIHNVLLPAGFIVKRWTRLPYLCEGDLSRSFYWLNDAVFFLEHNT